MFEEPDEFPGPSLANRRDSLAHDIESQQIIDRTVADSPFDGRSRAGDLFGSTHHVGFPCGHPSTAADWKRCFDKALPALTQCLPAYS